MSERFRQLGKARCVGPQKLLEVAIRRGALAAGDKDGAATALRFVQEYDAFIAMISNRQH